MDHRSELQQLDLALSMLAEERKLRRIVESERDEWRDACQRARAIELALWGVGPVSTFHGAAYLQREACAVALAEEDWELERRDAMALVRATPLVTKP